MTIADINQEIRDLTDTSSTSLTNATLLRRVNSALEQVVGWIINADGTWQYDDTNYTTHPRGTGTLVEGQEDYAFTSEYLQIEAIEILNNASPARYIRIEPLDHKELKGFSTQEYFGLTSAGNPAIGFPRYFDQNGDTIRLFPAPTSTQVTLTAGIRIYFKRTAELFTSAQVTTGTKEPGFASPYHVILAYMAAIPYLASYKPNRVGWIERKIGDTKPSTGLKAEIIEHYSHREKTRTARIRIKERAFR